MSIISSNVYRGVKLIASRVGRQEAFQAAKVTHGEGSILIQDLFTKKLREVTTEGGEKIGKKAARKLRRKTIRQAILGLPKALYELIKGIPARISSGVKSLKNRGTKAAAEETAPPPAGSAPTETPPANAGGAPPADPQ